MKILLKRPEDPGLAALWDEAKRSVLDHCLCGKRTACACRMRLPVVDEPGATDEGDDE